MSKAHQRIIREQKQRSDNGGLFGYPQSPDIKKAELREVDFQTAKKIIEEYEWLGTMGTTQFHYGIYFDGVCAGVVGFGYFQSMFNKDHLGRGGGYGSYVGDKYWDKGIQLTRGACVWWAHEHSGSKLIAYGLREMAKKGYKFVIAFSDPEAGEIGTLYQATNWHFIGNSGTVHYDIHYEDGRLYMNNRDFNKKFGKGGFKNKSEFISDKKGLVLKTILPKGRYVKLIGNKKENEEMMKHLKDKIQPYPKRK
jgi:hypothetical protein